MTTDPFWLDDPDSWNTVLLNGKALPGRARVKASVGRKLDVRSAPGRDGATIVDKGYQPAKIEIELLFWEAEHYAAWQREREALFAWRSRQRSPLSIVHPALSDLGIREVYLEEVGALEPASQYGAWELKLKFVQYAPVSRPNRTHRAQPVDAAGILNRALQNVRTGTAAPRPPPLAVDVVHDPAPPSQTGTGPT